MFTDSFQIRLPAIRKYWILYLLSCILSLSLLTGFQYFYYIHILMINKNQGLFIFKNNVAISGILNIFHKRLQCHFRFPYYLITKNIHSSQR